MDMVVWGAGAGSLACHGSDSTKGADSNSMFNLGGDLLGCGMFVFAGSAMTLRILGASARMTDDFGESLDGGLFCNLLVWRCGCVPVLGAWPSSLTDSDETIGWGDCSLTFSSDTLSESSVESSKLLPFLSLRLKNPLSMPFFSFRLRSSLLFSGDDEPFSSDSMLGRFLSCNKSASQVA